MARTGKSKPAEPIGKGTPSRSDRKVLKRAGDATLEDVPDVAGLDGGKKIEPVDLSLHGDGVDHWQDELPSHRAGRNSPKQKG